MIYAASVCDVVHHADVQRIGGKGEPEQPQKTDGNGDLKAEYLLYSRRIREFAQI